MDEIVWTIPVLELWIAGVSFWAACVWTYFGARYYFERKLRDR